MSRQDAVVAVLWALFAVVLGGVVVYGLTMLVQPVTDIVVAVVGAAAMLMVPILNYTLSLQKQQIFELQRQKQENYTELLESWGHSFARKGERETTSRQHTYALGWLDRPKL